MSSSLPLLPGAFPVLTCAGAQAWEKAYLDDDAKAWDAMSRAGRALAAAILRDAAECGGIPEDGHIVVLCGKGHNGGDALIALEALLAARKRATALVLIVPAFAALRPLARRALEHLHSSYGDRVSWLGVSSANAASDCTRAALTLAHQSIDLCLDGLFGMQFRPPLPDHVSRLIRTINEHRGVRVRVAVDLPSGVGDTSDAQPFRADFTYATGIAKRPLFAAENRGAVGRARFLDLGFPLGGHATEEGVAVLTDRVLDPLRAPRDANADKRTFGHLFIVSGSRTMPGAVLMAVESALLSGVGLVTAFVPETLAAAFAARLPEAMWVPMPETLDGGLALEGRGSVVARAARCTALLAGPGLGRDRESLALIAELLRAIDVPAVLDGDALQPDLVTTHYPGGSAARVLTPHAGEFARLGGEKGRDDEPALRALATRCQATMVLKGPITRVSEGGPVYFSPFGGPVLSRGGSGDVLAGLVAGQLAQGASALEAAARGVVWHGQAADRLARSQGQTATRVTALMPHLAAVLQERATIAKAASEETP